MTKGSVLAVWLVSACMATAAIPGSTGDVVKRAVSALGGTVAPCKDPGLNTGKVQAVCAAVPLTAAAFKTRWAGRGVPALGTVKLLKDWTADTDPDPAYKGAFSRVYGVNGGTLLVYFQPVRAQGFVSMVFSPAAAATPARKFRSCAEARAAGYSNMREGQPGYSSNLDRDGDGLACDK